MPAVMKSNNCAGLLSLTLAFLLVGCGESGPAKYTVRGVVTYQGKAVPTGSVMFVPQGSRPNALGAIQSDGTYQLEAVPGKHLVGITALHEIPPGKAGFEYRAPPPYVPVRFERPDQSGIVVEVEVKEENVIDLNLR